MNNTDRVDSITAIADQVDCLTSNMVHRDNERGAVLDDLDQAVDRLALLVPEED